MNSKMLHIDSEIIALNTISAILLVANWIGENLNTFGGFLVMMSVVVLNLAKAYNVIKEGKKKK